MSTMMPTQSIKFVLDACFEAYTSWLAQPMDGERTGRLEVLELVQPRLVLLLRSHEQGAETGDYHAELRKGVCQLLDFVSNEIQSIEKVLQENETPVLRGKIKRYQDIEQSLSICISELENTLRYVVLNMWGTLLSVGQQLFLTQLLSQQEQRPVSLTIFNSAPPESFFEVLSASNGQIDQWINAMGWTPEEWQHFVLVPPRDVFFALPIVKHLETRTDHRMFLFVPNVLQGGSAENYRFDLVVLERKPGSTAITVSEWHD